MNIQISVLIWTVINFCVLMFLLNRFLFKPLLAFMDARNEKIDRANQQWLEAERAHDAAAQKAEEDRLEAEKRVHTLARNALARAKRTAAQEAEEAGERYAGLLDQQRAEIEAERQELQNSLDAGLNDLVSAIAQKLAS